MDNNEEKMLPNEASSSQGIVEKLAQELDKKVVIFPPADVHPLLIDHVVQKIMGFFSVKDLKSARFVSKLWAVEGGRQILIKSHLCPKFKLTEEELVNFLSLAKPSAILKLYCQNKDILNIIGTFPELAKRVRELKYKYDNYCDQNLSEALNHITLTFWENPDNRYAFREFFIKNGETLKFLDIEMLINLKNTPNLTTQKPWEDDWLIPVDFPVLETMIISGNDETIWCLLNIALQLPRLKKLVLARVPEFVSKKIQEWEKNVLANGRKLQSLSIEQVELTCPIKYSSFVVLNGSLWPNLKSLKVNLNYIWSFASSIFSPSLFSGWEGLEILELNFQLTTFSEFTMYQEWLMGGVKFPGNYESGSVIVNESDLYSSPASKLVDLKNLRSLTIYPKNFLLGDFLVYNCLQFMTNLQTLRFGGQSMLSDGALKVLKNKLGDIVSLLDKE